MLIIGTSGLVAPASELPTIAKDKGAVLIEINPEPSQLTPLVDLHLSLTATAALSQIMNRVKEVW
jgi:NAD-dependent deacetylase